MEDNSEKLPTNEPEFAYVEITSSLGAREAFLATDRQPVPETEKIRALDAFISNLQREANGIFPGPERDLWFNLQLTKVFTDAGRWEDALKAVKDAQLVSVNMRKGDNVFQGLREEIEAKLQRNA